MMPTSSEIVAILEVLDAAGVPPGSPPRMLLGRVRSLALENERLARMLDADGRRGDRERLLARLDEDESITLMQLADACLDAGNEGEAKGWAYLGQRRLSPVWDLQGKVYLWLAWSPPTPFRWTCLLPRSLLEALSPRDFQTRREAFEAVVEAIASGRWKEQAAG